MESPNQENDSKSFLSRTVDSIKLEYEKIKTFIFSSENLKKFISIFIFGLLLFTALVVSIVGYCIFYYNYIPKIGHGLPCYFSYNNIKDEYNNIVYNSPKAFVDLSTGNWKKESILTGGQYYNIVLELNVQDTKTNYDIGNFMVKLVLQHSNMTLEESYRPCIVKQKSTITRYANQVVKLLPNLLELTDESQTIRLPLINNYLEDERSKYSTNEAVIYLSTNDLRLYSAKLIFETRFYGLRYYMYYWKIPTALLIISIIMFWESIILFFVWRIFIRIINDIFEIHEKNE